MARRPNEKTARFELRCSPQELKAWRTTANNCDMSLARFVRECVTQHLPSESQHDCSVSRPVPSKIFTKHPVHFRPTDPALLRQLAAIGNNLNQIAHWANAHKSRQEAKPVEEEVGRTRKALENLLNSGGNYAD